MQLSQALQGYTVGLLAEGYSPLTVAAYRSSLGLLVEYLKDPEVTSIKEKDLKGFLGYLRTTYHPDRSDNGSLGTASLHRYWKSIRSFFKWAERELSTERPDLSLQMPRYNHKEIVPYAEDEVQKLLKACTHSAVVKPGNRREYQFRRSTANRDRALVLTLLDTGVRVGELTRLRISDVNLENGEIQVRPHRIGKTRPRVVIIGKTARKAIWKYLTERSDAKPADPLFLNHLEHEMTRYSVLSLLVHLGKRANVPSVHPHRFRHTFAIQFLRNGGDVFTLQRLLGHSNLEMVRHYLSLADSDSAEAHRKSSPVDRWSL